MQERTGFRDWHDNMVCAHLRAPAEVMSERLQALAAAGSPPSRAHQARLMLTWGSPRMILIDHDDPRPIGPLWVSAPLAGPVEASCVVWVEASPQVCSQPMLHAITQALVNTLKATAVIYGNTGGEPGQSA